MPCGHLQIKLLRGRNLRSMELLGQMDVYGRIGLLREPTTDLNVVIDGGTNPDFTKTRGASELHIPLFNSSVPRLVIELYDHDSVTADDFIGGCKIALDELLWTTDNGGVARHAVPPTRLNAPLKTDENEPAGELEFELSFRPSEAVEAAAVRDPMAEEEAAFTAQVDAVVAEHKALGPSPPQELPAGLAQWRDAPPPSAVPLYALDGPFQATVLDLNPAMHERREHARICAGHFVRALLLQGRQELGRAEDEAMAARPISFRPPCHRPDDEPAAGGRSAFMAGAAAGHFPCCYLPREANLLVLVYCKRERDEATDGPLADDAANFKAEVVTRGPEGEPAVLVAWSSLQVFEPRGALRTGLFRLPLWRQRPFLPAPFNGKCESCREVDAAVQCSDCRSKALRQLCDDCSALEHRDERRAHRVTRLPGAGEPRRAGTPEPAGFGAGSKAAAAGPGRRQAQWGSLLLRVERPQAADGRPAEAVAFAIDPEVLGEVLLPPTRSSAARDRPALDAAVLAGPERSPSRSPQGSRSGTPEAAYSGLQTSGRRGSPLDALADSLRGPLAAAGSSSANRIASFLASRRPPHRTLSSRLREVLEKGNDPYWDLDGESREAIRANADHFTSHSCAFAKFIECLDFSRPRECAFVEHVIRAWTPITPHDALQLMDRAFNDRRLRRYAAERIGTLPDEELADYMLQLVQGLRHTAYLDAPLTRLLFWRGLRNPRVVGLPFLWALRWAEGEETAWGRRSKVLGGEFERACAAAGHAFVEHQRRIVETATAIAHELIQTKGGAEARLARLKSLVERQVLAEQRAGRFPASFSLPIDAHFQATGVDLSQGACHVYSSGKVPFMLTFTGVSRREGAEAAGPGRLRAIFKAGQDLRTDELCLRMIAVMDKLWKAAGLDLLLTPYETVSTARHAGVIRVVERAHTIGSIMKEAGGAAMAFSETVIADWLNSRMEIPYHLAQQNFARSCAGYCVATYVLGLCDRHSDNVMLFADGRMFHIDFGRFLGHVTKVGGFIPKETSPFLFTREYAFVMEDTRGVPVYEDFVRLCGDAFIVLRRHRNLFLHLCMLLHGRRASTCMYERFVPGLQSEADVRQHFVEQINVSSGNWLARVYNMCHLVKLGKKS